MYYVPISCFRILESNFNIFFLNKVLPYLENLHFPSPPGSSGGSPLDEGGGMVNKTENILIFESANLFQQTVTEHQLRLRREEQEKEKVAEKEEEGEQANKQMQLVRKKSKTTSCIKLKNGCKTQ